MITVWCCTCSKCGKEVASRDKQALDFKCGGWKYDRENREWICDECVDRATKGEKAKWI